MERNQYKNVFEFLEYSSAAAAAKLLQSCPTLCDPMDGSPLGSSVPGILQARILEWVAYVRGNMIIHEEERMKVKKERIFSFFFFFFLTTA